MARTHQHYYIALDGGTVREFPRLELFAEYGVVEVVALRVVGDVAGIGGAAFVDYREGEAGWRGVMVVEGVDVDYEEGGGGGGGLGRVGGLLGRGSRRLSGRVWWRF